MKTTRSRRDKSGSDPLAAAHSQTLSAFESAVRARLKPVLGEAGLRRVQTDTGLVTQVAGGVIVHAPLRQRGRPTPQGILKGSPFIGVLATTVALTDPVTGAKLEPGAYAVRVRQIARRDVAFDYVATKGETSVSTIARQHDGGPPGWDFPWVDGDITIGGPDELVPPGTIYLCLSFLFWGGCWFIDWPEWLPWPF
jgi:hypothetical protein